MSELTEFLLARIAEDEASARDALETFTSGVSTPPTWSSRRQWERFRPAIAEQIRRHDPARVLAECAAKRQIVDWAAPVGGIARVQTDRPGVYGMKDVRYVSDDGEDLLRILAAIYADHPDYRAEWVL